MPRRSSQLAPDRASFGIYGVYFVYTNAGVDWMWEYGRAWGTIDRQITNAVSWAIDRQKRTSLMYWDVLTWLSGDRTKELTSAKIPELDLLDRLMGTIARGRLDEGEIRELNRLESIRDVITRYGWINKRAPIFGIEAATRANSKWLTLNSQGQVELKHSGLFRSFEVEMDDADGSLAHVPWYRLIVLSMLVQIRVDLEIYYETGHRRLARCARRSCRAWFVRRPMGRKQRFCSDVCRATSFRDSSRKVGAPALAKRGG